jgi:hypothetical protein
LGTSAFLDFAADGSPSRGTPRMSFTSPMSPHCLLRGGVGAAGGPPVPAPLLGTVGSRAASDGAAISAQTRPKPRWRQPSARCLAQTPLAGRNTKLRPANSREETVGSVTQLIRMQRAFEHHPVPSPAPFGGSTVLQRYEEPSCPSHRLVGTLIVSHRLPPGFDQRCSRSATVKRLVCQVHHILAIRNSTKWSTGGSGARDSRWDAGNEALRQWRMATGAGSLTIGRQLPRRCARGRRRRQQVLRWHL